MSSQRKKTSGNQFRIIAGTWRGRRLGFPPGTTVRPTGDRVRETLFNWLNPLIEGTRCLDLFAGSGALGLEALSRSAREVVFVERDRPLTETLRQNLATLKCANASVYCDSAEKWLSAPHAAFDLVFLDPPFGDQALDKLCKLLSDSGSVTDGGHCYLEMAATTPPPELPTGWSVLKDKRAGQVRFQLIRIDSETHEKS